MLMIKQAVPYCDDKVTNSIFFYHQVGFAFLGRGVSLQTCRTQGQSC